VEAKVLMEKNDPGSPAAMDLARRWKGLIEEFTGGDEAVLGKLRGVWNEAFSDPSLAPKLPISRELMGFVSQAMAAASRK
jgi:hypothetical protein